MAIHAESYKAAKRVVPNGWTTQLHKAQVTRVARSSPSVVSDRDYEAIVSWAGERDSHGSPIILATTSYAHLVR